MDITPQDTQQQPISDDQELAKALAGVMPDAPEQQPDLSQATTQIPEVPVMQFEETPAPQPVVAEPEPAPVVEPVSLPSIEPLPAYEAPSNDDQPSSGGELEGIKNDALLELRPLIDKVDLPPEEKFDTYLMLIRSTDDASLIGPAHTVAQSISDEKRRAEALLDIIKEIDFLSHSDQNAA